jgi:hypothetical protein
MFWTVVAIGQTSGRSTLELLKDLTYQTGRNDFGLSVTFSCGQAMAAAKQDRALANVLVARGTSAVPDLNAAFDSMQRAGHSPFLYNGSWLLIAYAKILGRDAFPRLRQMAENPRLSELEYYLDASTRTSMIRICQGKKHFPLHLTGEFSEALVWG